MIAPAAGLRATVGLIAHDRQLIERTRQVAFELGVELCVLAVPGGVVTSGAAIHRPGAQEGLADLIASAARCDVVTFECSALSPAQRVILHSAGITLRPGPQAAELVDDPTRARDVLRECGFDVVPSPDSDATDPPSKQHGNAATVQSSRPAATWVGELTIVIARRPSGFRVVYPVVDAGGGGRPHLDPASPAPTPAATVERAVDTAISITDGIDAAGIITVEFFLDHDDRPLVNRVLLGPHCKPQPNTEPANISQFENHLRAILDCPLRPAPPDRPLT